MSARDLENVIPSDADEDSDEMSDKDSLSPGIRRGCPHAPTLLRMADLLGHADAANDAAKLNAVLDNQRLLAEGLNALMTELQEVKKHVMHTRDGGSRQHNNKTVSTLTTEAAKKWFDEELLKHGMEEAMKPVVGKDKSRILEELVYPRLGFMNPRTANDRQAMEVRRVAFCVAL
jgi:hypothetical protein